MYYSDPFILFRPFIAQQWAAIERTIINQNNFQLFIFLRDDTFDTSIQVPLNVIYWHYYAHKRAITHQRISLAIVDKFPIAISNSR